MVLCEVDADFVLIADGKMRPVAKPKRKRRKHLNPTSRELPGMLSRYREGRLQDSDLRKALDPENPSTDPIRRAKFVQE